MARDPDGRAASQGPSGWRSLAFSAVVVPAVFVLIELALWSAGVAPLLSDRDPFAGFSRRNPVFEEDRARGVFRIPDRAVLRSFNRQEFRSIKPRDGFRFFTLGGSSAFGFPWGEHVAFTHVLGEALQASSPGRTIEAVNAGAMSYASHRLLVMTHEILRHEPDLIIVYGGHNEFVERGFYRLLRERDERLDPLRALLHRWRLYGLMTRLLLEERRGVPAPETAGEMLGLDVVREEEMDVRDAAHAEVVEAFERNISEMVDRAHSRGVLVVLCTVPSNLRDWKPNQSIVNTSLGPAARGRLFGLIGRAEAELARGNPGTALPLLEEARLINPGYAQVHFDLGQASEALSQWESARESYRRARDLDAQPTRAQSGVNDAIRRVAAGKSALLVDVDRLFEHEAPHGLVGLDLIEDYVHPTPRGHRLIALAIWKLMEERGVLGPARAADEAEFWATVGPAPDREAAAVHGSDAETASRKAHWLFTMAEVLRHQGLSDRAEESYRASLALEPRLHAASFNLAHLLLYQGRHAEAAEGFAAALAIEPSHLRSRIGLGMAQVGMGRADLAEATLRRAVDLDPGSPDAWNVLGHSLVLQEDLDAAAAAFRRAIDLDPVHYNALANLGSALLRQGRPGEGIDLLRRSLSIQDAQPRVRNDLADALAAAGRVDEAESLYRINLSVLPGDPRSRAGLARIRERRGRPRR